MKKIVFITSWYGKLRDDFPFWVKSVEHNPTVDFLLLTDCELPCSIPNNLKVVNMRLNELESLARKNVWENAILHCAYKMCDYRPAYGEMFRDYIRGYDFWGHCDLDGIFGDIRCFMTDELLSLYDRIGSNGPFTLYRNTDDVNKIYRECGRKKLKQVFENQTFYGFDEWGGETKDGTTPWWLQHHRERIYTQIVWDNIEPYVYPFISNRLRCETPHLRNEFFYFENGKLYRYATDGERVDKSETLLVHVQKRKLSIKTKVSDNFLILPPAIYTSSVANISRSWIRWHVRDGRWWAYYTRFCNKIQKYIGRGCSSDLVLHRGNII